ncbi:MAG TPA: LytR C-terminal domain-containing protein [Patescibacteria group bacterium]|nr:LytR C-terminal domain-containing protein [Patescibacteria group bacterium]
MPKEEKEYKKKLRVVTEEVTAEPEAKIEEVKQMETPEETKIVEEVPVDEVSKDEPRFGVRETQNIDLNRKEERGAFVKIFFVTFFATLLAFLLAGGIYVYLTGIKGGSVSPTPTPTTEAITEPTPTPTPTADLSTFKISVLNGNGGIGVATAAKAVIEKAGFTVTDVGNADNFNFTDTLVQVKSTVPSDVVEKIKNALSANYSVAMGDPLDANSNFDIVITVGSK